MKYSHRPVTNAEENTSYFQAIRRFIPLIFVYSFRHLTTGTLIRRRLKKLKQNGEKWIIED